jgi:hypothetical protein
MKFCRALRYCLFTASVLASFALQAPAPSSSPSPSTSATSKPVKKSAPTADAKLDPGKIVAGVYRNRAFGFACKIPPAWVLRTEEMNARELEDENADAGKKATDAGRVLLAAFSRPPEARGEDVNGSIVIVAESAAAYPGLKDAAQYFGPVTEVALAQGFDVDDDPYEFAVGTKTVVRGDFEKNVGTRVMLQSTIVVLARGYAISFTFIGGTEDEVEELVQRLSFAASAKPSK